MKIIRFASLLMAILLLQTIFLQAQKDSTACKVNGRRLQGRYTSSCKNGLSNGKVAAKTYTVTRVLLNCKHSK